MKCKEKVISLILLTFLCFSIFMSQVKMENLVEASPLAANTEVCAKQTARVVPGCNPEQDSLIGVANSWEILVINAIRLLNLPK